MQGVVIEAMTTIQNILFPVDFSPSCVAMAAYVKRAAAMFGAKVTLVHVFDLYSHDAFQLYVRTLSEVAEEEQNLARSRLDSFLKSEFLLAEGPRISPCHSRESPVQILPAASAYVPGRVKRSSCSSCGFSFPSDGFTLGLH